MAYYDYDSAQCDEKFEKAILNLRLNAKKVPKLNSAERALLEFCHGRNMREFLKEEFEKHPIRLDENGDLIGGNPFDKERRERGDNSTYQGYDPLYNAIGAYGGEY